MNGETWITCRLCGKRFISAYGNQEKALEQRKAFEQHMVEKHDYILREGWGWVPAMAKCPECPMVVRRSGLPAHRKTHEGVKQQR